MFKRTRPMLAPQAYLHIFTDKLMPTIEADYVQHLKTKKPMGNFAFRNKRAGELLEEETDTIKELVEKYRLGELDLDNADIWDDDDEEMEALRSFLEVEAEQKAKEKDK